MPDINEPTVAEIEVVAQAIAENGVGRPWDALLAARRVSPQSDNEPTEAEIDDAAEALWNELCPTVRLTTEDWAVYRQAAKVTLLAARRVSSVPSFADGIEAAAKRIEAEGAKYLPGGLMDMKRICHDLASDVRALAHNPQASSGGGRLNDQGHSYRLSTDALDVLMAHGLLAKVGGAYRLATRDELLADPGSAGVNCNSPEAVLAVVRAVLTSSEPPQLSHTDPLRSGAAEGNEAEAPAPKPDPAIARLVEGLRELLDLNYLPDEPCRVGAKTVEKAISALTASNDRVAELERKNAKLMVGIADMSDEARAESMLRRAAEAEVSRLKAGAVTGWQSIESAPKDGRSIAVWLPATATEQPHAFAPVSICEDGTWWDDSTGDQIEPLAATYWAPIHAPSALSNQAGASK